MATLPRITIPSTPRELHSLHRGTWHKRNSSTACTEDHRWSEIVPPESALTFSIIWDPAGEVAMFSNAELLGPRRSDPHPLASPIDIAESRSQVLTVEQLSNNIPLTDNTPTLAMFYEKHDSMFPARSPLFDRQMRVGRARRSSTYGGLDIYFRGSVAARASHVHRYASIVDLGMEHPFGSLESFVRLCLDYAEGAVEIADSVASERHFLSVISVSTTVPSSAPSGYLTVLPEPTSESTTNSTWSEMEPPSTPTYPHPMRPQPVEHSSRRLRKPKPSHEPLPPAQVLERDVYNHESEPRHHSWKQYRLPNIANSIRKWVGFNGNQGSSEAWVWIELSQEITHHYLE